MQASRVVPLAAVSFLCPVNSIRSCFQKLGCSARTFRLRSYRVRRLRLHYRWRAILLPFAAIRDVCDVPKRMMVCPPRITMRYCIELRRFFNSPLQPLSTAPSSYSVASQWAWRGSALRAPVPPARQLTLFCFEIGWDEDRLQSRASLRRTHAPARRH